MKNIFTTALFLLLTLSMAGQTISSLTAQDIPVNEAIDEMFAGGDYEKVIDACRQILAYDSLNPEIHYKMGIAYQNILDENLAFESFYKASSINPDNKAYSFALAKGYFEKGKFKLAEPLLSKVYSSDSINWAYAYYLSSIYMHYDRYDDAIKIYKRFLMKDSANYNYLNKMAFASLKKGNYEYAADLYNKSLLANKKNLVAIKNLAYLYSAAGRTDTAIQILTKGIEIDPSDMDLFAKRAQYYYSKNKHREALNDYLVILSSGDSSALYLKRAGICYCNIKQFREATKYLLPALKADTSDYRTCSYLGFCYYNLNDINNSIYYYDKVIGILTPVYAQMGMTYRYIAASQIKKGMYKSAVTSFLEAQSITKDPNIYMEIANVYDEKLKNSERAIYYYQVYLKALKNAKTPSPTDYVQSIQKRIDYLKENPVK